MASETQKDSEPGVMKIAPGSLVLMTEHFTGETPVPRPLLLLLVLRFSFPVFHFSFSSRQGPHPTLPRSTGRGNRMTGAGITITLRLHHSPGSPAVAAARLCLLSTI